MVDIQGSKSLLGGGLVGLNVGVIKKAMVLQEASFESLLEGIAQQSSATLGTDSRQAQGVVDGVAAATGLGGQLDLLS